ncbi:uncharacterized protein [Littorina saxatilis]|uniref:Uncharacterized protein n=1 Tax=Littorina saxatilis TaxID=31220 RepID=A0AAN9C224_9CAEN
MAQRSHRMQIREALQRFTCSLDPSTELAVLDSLVSSRPAASVRDKLLTADKDGADPEADDVDVTSPANMVATHAGNHLRDVAKHCGDTRGDFNHVVSAVDDDLEVDLGNGDLAQSPWSRRSSSLTTDLTPIPQNISHDDADTVPCSLHARNQDQNTSYRSRNDVLQLQNIDLHCLLQDSLLAETLVEYVFFRRYSSADKQHEEGSTSVMELDQQTIAALNKKLDDVIKRLMDYPVTEQLASAFCAVLQKTSGMPNLRKKLLEHIMLWLSSSKTGMDDAVYRHVKALMFTGLSDVWSVLRKVCSAGISRVFRDWSHKQQEGFFSSILEICINMEGSWQSKDGAALCVLAIMNNCFAQSTQSKGSVGELPTYIVECVLTMVFSLISHPQLSVRETVAKIMTSYMDHVDSQDMLDLMHQTLTLLNPPAVKEDSSESVYCIEAYAAEGLLNICTSIFKALPVRNVVHLWLTHRVAFLAYLSHGASSVRQTTSSLCMRVATHSEGGAVLLKAVLYHLTQAWHVSLQSLASCHHFVQDAEDDGMTWEGKEGRMLVYELLCKHLTEVHTAVSDSRPSTASWSDVCSQDGGSEARESVEEVYVGIARYLARQSPLTQLYLLDDASRLAQDAGFQVLEREQMQDFQRWLLLHHTCSSNRSCNDIPDSDQLTVASGQELLMTVLHQTAVCLAHRQWELRRIAQQVLPCLCEVMCLYDVRLVMSVWGYMTEESNLQSFVGLSALHHSLALCARLVATADLTDKDSAPITDTIYLGLVNGVRKHVGQFLPVVCCHLRREAYDKMSVVAAETALLALNFFELQEQIKEELCSAVVHLWRNLFTFAHPKSAMVSSLFPVPEHTFQSPYEGFLSCCLVRLENDAQCAKQVEKHLMLAVHKHLPHFLPQLNSSDAAVCLPLLAHNIGLFIDDSDVCKSLINSFSTLCQYTKGTFSKMASDTSTQLIPDSQPLKCAYFTVRELTAVIALKGLDLALLQKVLNCYLVVCNFLKPQAHVPLLLQAVASRLNEVSGFHADSSDRGAVDVGLCCHRPDLPPGFGQNTPPQDADFFDLSGVSEENASDTSLNCSGSSLGLQMYARRGRRRTLSTTEDTLSIREVAANLSPRGVEGEEKGQEEPEEEQESDWDSWSEEEHDQEHSVLQTHFQDFFRRLTDFYGADGRKMLQDELEKFGKGEQRLLEDLIMT